MKCAWEVAGRVAAVYSLKNGCSIGAISLYAPILRMKAFAVVVVPGYSRRGASYRVLD